jgi:hypothetical protein
MDFITNWVIPITFYSGPFFTYGVVAKLYPTPKRVLFFKASSIIHLLAFLPFVYLALNQKQDFLHALVLPALTGFVLFLSGVFYMIYSWAKSKEGIT